MRTATLDELCEINIGRTPARAEPTFWGAGHRWLSIADMNQGLAITKSKEQITDAGARAGRLVQPGTVLLSFKLSIGKVGIAEVPLYTNEAIAALPVKDERVLDPRYLMRALEAMELAGASNPAAMGATLNKKSLAQIRVPLPPLAEQRRIAAILNQADTLRTKRRHVLTHLDSLTQAVFNDMFGRDMPTTTLGALVDFYIGGTPSKARKDYWEGDVPWFSAKDLKASDLWDSRDHIASKVTQETSLRLLPPNTITMVVRGMILAHTVPVTTVRVPATINQDLKALIPKADIDIDYLSAAIRARSDWILARVSTAAHGTKKLESTVLESIPVPDAESRQQCVFAARVAQVETQRTMVARAVMIDEELFASLQARAFRGEL